jgi:hypothetical protein
MGLDIIQQCEHSLDKLLFGACHRHITVSIQLLWQLQGSRRSQPTNKICRAAYDDLNKKRLCDLSDRAAKIACEKGGSDWALGYLCPEHMSNIVIPYADEIVSKRQWFIFLGRFALLDNGCTTVARQDCPLCTDLLERHQIRALRENEKMALGQYKTYVSAGMFCDQQHKLPGDCILDVFELIACRDIAKDGFSQFLRQLGEQGRAELTTYALKTETDYKEQMAKATASRKPTVSEPKKSDAYNQE